VTAGELSATIEGSAVRWLRYGGVEILRGVDLSVRDQSWGTVGAVITNVRLTSGDASTELSFHAAYRSAEVDFEADASITFAPDHVRYVVHGVANRTFWKNRIGLVVLHPMSVAGSALQVVTTSGPAAIRFPGAIDPGTPATDLTAMSWSPARGLRASLTLDGERWELEDQRNWIDASFKTFPTPLRVPFPVEVPAGTVIDQSVTLELSGRTSARTRPEPAAVRIGSRSSARLPALGVADAGPDMILGPAATSVLRATRLSHVRAYADLESSEADGQITHALDLAERLDAAIELDVNLGDDPVSQALEVAGRLVASGRRVVSLNAFTRASRSGFDSTTDVLAAARNATRSVGLLCPVGGGTRANFTELNRARLPAESMDVVTYALNPQVHAFDEASIVETLEAIPVTVRQARAMSANRPLSLVLTLKPRFNSATGIRAVEVDPDALPAQVDRRQAGGFAAAWTVGSLAVLAKRGIERVTCYEAAGMAGVVADPADPLHADFPSPPGRLYPIFGVLEALTTLGQASVRTAAVSADIAVLAVSHRGGIRILGANLDDREANVSVVGEWTGAGAVRRLSGAPVALGQPVWSAATRVIASRRGAVTVPLGPYEVICVDWRRPGGEPQGGDA
jgi:hypothetical protein